MMIVKPARIKFYLFITLLLPVGVSLAAPPAVDSSNYEMSFHSADTTASGNRVSYYYQFGLKATTPLGQYLGFSLAGNYGNTTLLPNAGVDTNNVAHHWGTCNYHSTGLNTALFVRNPTLGRLGIGYGENRLSSHCLSSFIANGSNNLKSSAYSTSAEYYFKRVTIAASWSKTKIENSGDQTSDRLNISWYPTNISRIDLSAEGLDLKNTYVFAIEYQPNFLSNALGVDLNITEQRQTITTHTIMVGFRYYFGTNVDLIQRDRYYR